MSQTLFATSSLFSGAARTLDLGGVYDEYNLSRTPAEADAAAIALDWLAVGDALRIAAMRYKLDSEKQKQLPL